MTTVPRSPAGSVSGHLEYYLKYGLNPVHYEMHNRTRHFQRRASLYRSLGIHPLTVRDSRVLEVAAGTGQNSLYLASLRPRQFTLVEPNPVAVRDIKALYAQPEFAAIRPELHEKTFQDFVATEPYDLAVCENWLGQRPEERALLRKLGGLIAPGGMLVVTTVAPVGILPNVLRRLLAIRLGCWEHSFEDTTRILTLAFTSHLATVEAMTRNCTDWVQDNIMNPHYFNIILTIPMVVEDLGAAFSFVGSSPDFVVDWRWFKALYGEARDFNGHFLTEYHANCHNFLDYRRVLPRRDAAVNETLEIAAWRFVETAAREDEAARMQGTHSADAHAAVLERFQDVVSAVAVSCPENLPALREFEQLYCQPQLRAEDVRDMQPFAGLFGRETLYISLEKQS